VRLLNSVRVPHRDQHDRVGGRSSGPKFAADRGRAPTLVGGGREKRVQAVRSDGHTQRLEPDYSNRENVSTRVQISRVDGLFGIPECRGYCSYTTVERYIIYRNTETPNTVS